MSTTATKPQTVKELALGQLTTSRNFLLGLVETLHDSGLTRRAGGAGNHALWVLGHIAVSDDLFHTGFSGQPSQLPAGYIEKFGQGSTPSDLATDYPSLKELKETLATCRQQLVQWVESLDDQAQLQEPPENIRGFTRNAISAPFTLAQHEFMHAGQLTTIRATLDMKPLFG